MLEALMLAMTPGNIALSFFGAVVGSICGCIPGLNTPIAITLVLPFLYQMDQVSSIALLMGIFMGGISGGYVSAILLRIPGTSSSVATTFDGYPMAKSGRAAEALEIAAFSSFFGGVFSLVALILLAGPLAEFAIIFGPWEYFGTFFLSLSMVCLMVRGDTITKAYLAMGIGVMTELVGLSPVDGMVMRYTMGLTNLQGGFDIVAVLIGVFAFPEILSNCAKLRNKVTVQPVKKKRFYFMPLHKIKYHFKNMLQSSVIGVVIGIIPGMGGGPAGLMAYTQAKRISKTPEQFGSGCEDGVVATESANNATTGGTLIPMLALGVPGDTSSALILSAFSILGIATGTKLTMQEPMLYKAILILVLVANIFMYMFQVFSVRYLSKIVQVPQKILLPVLTVFCVTGVICVNGNPADLYYALGFMFLGYVLEKNNYPIAPFILGIVLGGAAEGHLRRAIVYYGDFAGCISQPSLGTIFFIMGLIIPIVVLGRGYFRGKKNQV